MSLINPAEELLQRLLRNASTADLYDITATALTEIKARQDASPEGDEVEMHVNVRVEAQYADIRWEADEGRFVAVFLDEGSASLAVDETRAPTAVPS